MKPKHKTLKGHKSEKTSDEKKNQSQKKQSELIERLLKHYSEHYAHVC